MLELEILPTSFAKKSKIKARDPSCCLVPYFLSDCVSGSGCEVLGTGLGNFGGTAHRDSWLFVWLTVTMIIWGNLFMCFITCCFVLEILSEVMQFIIHVAVLVEIRGVTWSINVNIRLVGGHPCVTEQVAVF